MKTDSRVNPRPPSGVKWESQDKTRPDADDDDNCDDNDDDYDDDDNGDDDDNDDDDGDADNNQIKLSIPFLNYAKIFGT